MDSKPGSLAWAASVLTIEPQQLGKQQPSQSSTYTAQVTLNAPVTHMAATQYAASEFIRGQPEILFIRKKAMLSGFFDFKMLFYFASVYASIQLLFFDSKPTASTSLTTFHAL